MWSFIVAHLTKYGKQPTVPTIIENFPEFNFELSEEPLSYLRDRFVANFERQEAGRLAREIATACVTESDVGSLADLILDKGRELKGILPTRPPARLSDALERVKEYEKLAKVGDPFAGKLRVDIPEIDDATLGIQPHELVTVCGWTGLGKSTLTQWLMLNFYNQGKRCLFITLEMTAEALFRKWDQMIQQFTSYKHLKQLNLSEEEVGRWRDWAKQAKKRAATADIIVVGGGGSEWTVERVHSEIIHHRPDVVAIDYITLMCTNGKQERWEQVGKIAQKLKDVAMQTSTPIFAVAQTNRESAKVGATLDNMAASMGISNASDIVIGLHQDDERRASKLMEVRLEKNRDGERLRTDVYWDMGKMHFADSFMREQVRKTREAEELRVVEEQPAPKPAHRLGQAAARVGDRTIDTETGEVLEDGDTAAASS